MGDPRRAQSSILDDCCQIQQSARRVQFVRVAAHQLQSGWSGRPRAALRDSASPLLAHPSDPLPRPNWLGHRANDGSALQRMASAGGPVSPPTDRHRRRQRSRLPTQGHPIGHQHQDNYQEEGQETRTTRWLLWFFLHPAPRMCIVIYQHQDETRIGPPGPLVGTRNRL